MEIQWVQRKALFSSSLKHGSRTVKNIQIFSFAGMGLTVFCFLAPLLLAELDISEILFDLIEIFVILLFLVPAGIMLRRFKWEQFFFWYQNFLLLEQNLGNH